MRIQGGEVAMVEDFEYLVSTAQEKMACGKEESPGWRKVSGVKL